MTIQMDLGPAATRFRDELREWLDANRPEELSGIDSERAAMLAGVPGVAEWADKLYQAGYMCVAWPKEFGGRGLSGVEVAVMNEEFARAGVGPECHASPGGWGSGW